MGLAMCTESEDLQQKNKITVFGDYSNCDTRILLSCL